ncbi:MAG: hypothetical protein HQK91_15025, partial [Nitrospirae bacterium]|nr:hypothetical protein [Nitrospirota bacterium]
ESTTKIGKLIQARNITTGSYADPTSADLHITSVVIGSEKNQEKGTHDSKGKLAEFFNLEKEVAKSILATLKYDWANVPEAAKVIHTKNYEAFVDYSVGLNYMDKEDYSKARESFKKAVDLDPNFKLAKEAYLAIPVAALTVAAIIATATSASPVAGTVTAVGVTSNGLSTGAIVGIIGGVGVVGVGIAYEAGAFNKSKSCSAYIGGYTGSQTYTYLGSNYTQGWAGSVDSNCNYFIACGALGDAQGKLNGNSFNYSSGYTCSGSISGTTMSGTYSGYFGGYLQTGSFSGTKK